MTDIQIIRRKGHSKPTMDAFVANVPPGNNFRHFREGIGRPRPGYFGINYGAFHPGYANSREAVAVTSNKSRFRKFIMESDSHEHIPKSAFTARDAAELLREKGRVIVRPAHHMKGQQMHVATNHAELTTAIPRCGQGWYAQEIVPKTDEYRVFVTQGRAVWVSKKVPPNPEALAWGNGVATNVRFDDWPLGVVRRAIEVFCETDLDFGAVDVVFDSRSKRIAVLEINSTPEITCNYRASATVKAFLHFAANREAFYHLSANKGGYKKFIHPAVHPEAWV